MNRNHRIQNLPHRLFRASALALATVLPLSVAVSPLVIAPAYALQAEEEDEGGFISTKKSKVTQIALPAGAFRYTAKKEIAKYTDALAKLRGPNNGPLGELEVLLWQDGKTAQKELPELLKKAGYSYAPQEALKAEGGRVIPFLSLRPGSAGQLVAFWVEQGDAVLLAWALSAPPAGKTPVAEPEAAPAPPTQAPGSQTARVAKSRLTGLALAPGAQAAGSPQQLSGVAEKLGQAARQFGLDAGIDPATAEMIGWESGSPAPRTALYSALQKAGYERTDHDGVKNDVGKYSFFTLVGPKDSLFGMWIENGTHLILAWGRVDAAGRVAPEVAPQNEAPAAPVVRPRVVEPDAAEAGNAVQVELAPATFYVNVMKGAMPRIPQFPQLAKKAGIVRGYVYDTHGRPLKGAKLGVRSTAVGGFYSGSAATTDEKGYYEIKAPAGVAHFYCAGYAAEHGEGLAAIGLHPADGSAGNFATPNGEVKNFVMLTYGITDRAKAQDDPRAGSNYYGGTVVLGWNIDDGGILSSPSYLPNNSTIEFTLTPTGQMLDGSQGRTIVIRKTVSAGSPSQLYVNNIPVGPYQVSARLVGGGALKMRESGPYANRAFGLEPKEAVGKTTLMFRPDTAQADMVPAAHGSWSQVSISLER